MRISDWSSDVCSSDLTGSSRMVRPTTSPVPAPSDQAAMYQQLRRYGIAHLYRLNSENAYIYETLYCLQKYREDSWRVVISYGIQQPWHPSSHGSSTAGSPSNQPSRRYLSAGIHLAFAKRFGRGSPRSSRALAPKPRPEER